LPARVVLGGFHDSLRKQVFAERLVQELAAVVLASALEIEADHQLGPRPVPLSLRRDVGRIIVFQARPQLQLAKRDALPPQAVMAAAVRCSLRRRSAPRMRACAEESPGSIAAFPALPQVRSTRFAVQARRGRYQLTQLGFALAFRHHAHGQMGQKGLAEHVKGLRLPGPALALRPGRKLLAIRAEHLREPAQVRNPP